VELGSWRKGPGSGHEWDNASVSGPGTRVEVVAEVAASRSAVWTDLERIEDHAEWMRDAVAIRFVGDRRRGTGTVFECDTKVGPIRLTDVMEVTDWEEGASMAVEHRGVVTGSGRFTLEEGPGTATTIRWRERLRFPWWLGGPIGGWVARPVLAALWRGNLRRLRARVEPGAEGPPSIESRT
jgi:hypothetical protein